MKERMRRVVSIFLVIILSCSVSINYTMKVYAKTETDVKNWMTSAIGRALDYDNAYGVQCVDFFNYYLRDVWGISNPISMYPVNSAYQIFDRAAPSGWQKISGNSNFKVGDIVIWGTALGTHGHVALVYSADSNGVTVIHENWGKKYVSIDSLPRKDAIRGVFRPTLDWQPDNNLTTDTRYPTPITCVPVITSGSISVYDSYGNVESGRRIDAGDQCSILNVYTNGLCEVSYPTSNGSRVAYAQISDFMPNRVDPYTWSPSNNLRSYQMSNMATVYGSVFSTDVCTVVGKKDNLMQVIYPVSGGYKMGWVNATGDTPIDPPKPDIIPGPKFVEFVGNKQVVVMIPNTITFSSTSYISEGDVCIADTNNIASGQCNVTYPSGGNNVFTNYQSKKTVTLNLTQVMSYNADFEYQKVTAQTTYTVYPTSAMTQTVAGSATNWALDPGDVFYTINKVGDATEVLYYCNRGTHSGYWKLGWVYLPYYMIDLNGSLDNNDKGTLEGFGCADVVVNENELGKNLTDFYQAFPCGSSYEFKNIRAYDGYTYNGVKSGSLSGVVNGDVNVRVAFTKNAVVCKGIVISKNPTKTNYLEGESLNTSGIEVTASYSDGSQKNVTSSCTYSGYSNTPGIKTVKVSYSGYEAAFTVNVNEKSVTSVEKYTEPTKTIYDIGEQIDFTGIKLKVNYNNGTSEIVSDYYVIDEQIDTSTEGEKTVNVYYWKNGREYSVVQKINVIDKYKYSPTLFYSNQTVSAGQSFDVKLNLKDNPGIASLKVKIGFDESLLTLTNVTYNSAMGGSSQPPQYLRTPLILNWYNGTQNYNGNGTYATLTFKAISNISQNEVTNLNITYDEEDVYNINETNLGLKFDIGSITIIPSANLAKPVVSVKDVKDHSATISWKVVDGADGYILEKMNGSNVVETSTIEGRYITGRTLNNLSVLTTYQYRIKAYKNVNLIKQYSEESQVEFTTLDHIFSSVTSISKEATCTSEGRLVKTCETCGYQVEVVIARLEHRGGTATCSQKAKCELCGQYYGDFDADNHTYETYLVEPTCTQKGYTSHVCSGCGYSYKDSYKDKIGHHYVSKITNSATCISTGTLEHKCELCGDSYIEIIPMTEHDYVQTLLKNPTCTSKGQWEHKCSYCEDTYVSDIPALGHDYRETIIEPTDTVGGYTLHICYRCGDSYTDNYVEALTKENVTTENQIETESIKENPTTVDHADTGKETTSSEDKQEQSTTVKDPETTIKQPERETIKSGDSPTKVENNTTQAGSTVTNSVETTQSKEKTSPKKQKITIAKIKTYKVKILKKKKVTFSLKAKTTGDGKLKYVVYTCSPSKNIKYIKVSKNGKVTIKKGAKKGTYRIFISASGTDKYEYVTKIIKIKVK
ncbi:MAG: bacterial Ig-like domain-containing protein [Lachnospiraceae bacterium]|nr:bacterial Ig-like domain-containing protein [Lachnospiraceae bacterium]